MLMLLQMKNLVCFAKKHGKRAHKKREVFVSQVGKRFRESDLIRKAYHALAHTTDKNYSQFVEMEDMNMFELIGQSRQGK